MSKVNSRLNSTKDSTIGWPVFSLGSGLILLAAAPMGAQALPSTVQASDKSAQVEEVVVTAQKRTESLQSVPIAAQVVSGQTLVTQNIDTLSDLGKTLPAVHIVTSGNLSNALNVRGIGSGGGNAGFDQSVAMFVDDVYYGRSRMITSSFLDMDHIEILKGPQTTFFGNNAIAGAISMLTAKPGDSFSGYARALYGSFDTYALEGAVGGPINDKLAIRVAGTANGMTGWIRNIDTGKLAPQDQNYEGRFTAVFRPTSNFDATLKLEKGSSLTKGSPTDDPFQWTNCPPPSYITPNSRVNRFCPNALASGTPLGLNNNLNAGLAGQFAHLKWDQEVLTLKYENWGLNFTSVTARYGYNFSYAQDSQNVHNETFIATRFIAPEEYSQISQEFRVASPDNRRFEYMAGVYYQSDQLGGNTGGNVGLYNSNLSAIGIPKALYPAFAPYLPLAYQETYNQNENIESAFVSAGWHVTHQLKFNLGLRETHVHKDYVGTVANGSDTNNYAGFVLLPPALETIPMPIGKPGTYTPPDVNESNLMGSVGAQYQVTPSAMLYASFSRGFKAGGYSVATPTINIAASPGNLTPPYGPEHVNDYEGGLKSKWFDNRVLLNVALFRENYFGLQLNTLTPSGAIFNGVPVLANLTQNAASAISEGVEVETQWVISEHFRIGGDVTYLDAHYGSYPKGSPTLLQAQAGATSQDLSGKRLDFAPFWSGSLDGEYRSDFRGGYRFTADISPFFQSSYFNSESTDEPLYRIPGSVRLDAKLTLERPSQRWAVDLIGKNLTDAIIVVVQNGRVGGKEEPRNFAIQLRYKW